MWSRNYGDIGSGAFLAVLGVFVSWYAVGHYSVGTLQRMGPGMFPLMAGIVLAFMGLAIVVIGFSQQGDVLQIQFSAPFFVLLGVAAFALTIDPFGLIPAIIGSTVICSLAEGKLRLLSVALLSVTLCIVCWLIFRIGLSLPIPIVQWPF